MRFEFDPAKNAVNRSKHGISFEEAQLLWADERRVEFRTARPEVTEDRWVVVGALGGRVWAAVFTYRGDTIRIISVRRARASEAGWYDRQATNQR